MAPRNSLEERRQRAQSYFQKSEERKIEAAKSRHDYKAKIDTDAAKTARLRALRLAKEAADELAAKIRAPEKQDAPVTSPKATRKKLAPSN